MYECQSKNINLTLQITCVSLYYFKFKFSFGLVKCEVFFHVENVSSYKGNFRQNGLSQHTGGIKKGVDKGA